MATHHDDRGTAGLENVPNTSVLVNDHDTALGFYTSTLGLQKPVEQRHDRPRLLTVGVNGDDFQLGLWPGRRGGPSRRSERPRTSITIETDDCRATIA